MDKEPFFILWVTVEKKYENNTIYVEISDYEKGFIRGIEYTSPEPSLRRVVNEYMLPVNYSDEFNDYLGKKVAIKYYRNGKKPTDLFHVTHATLPNSKKNESSFESSKIDKDDLQPRKIRQDCIGRWNNTGTLPTKEAKYTTWKYEHVKPLEGDAKACPYENGKIIKIKYLDSPNRTKGEFLNPNINEKLISYPEYIFNILYTPPPPPPSPAAEAAAEAEAAAKELERAETLRREVAARRVQLLQEMEEKAKKKLEEEQKAAAAYIEKHRDLTKAGTKETVCESKTREELEKVLKENSRHYPAYINRTHSSSSSFGIKMGKVMDSEVEKIKKSCSAASEDDCLTLKNTNYSVPPTEYSILFGDMYQKHPPAPWVTTTSKHVFGVCNSVEYEFGADGERFKVTRPPQ